MKGSCEYIEYVVTDSPQGVVPQVGSCVGGITNYTSSQNIATLRNAIQGSGILGKVSVPDALWYKEVAVWLHSPLTSALNGEPLALASVLPGKELPVK